MRIARAICLPLLALCACAHALPRAVGAAHMVLQVDVASVERDRLETAATLIRARLRQARIPLTETLDGEGIGLRIVDKSRVADEKAALEAFNASTEGEGRFVISQQPERFLVSFGEAARAQLRDMVMRQSVEIVSRRIADLNVTPVISWDGDLIHAGVPGYSDLDSLRSALSPHTLALRLVADVSGEDVAGGRIPPGSELAQQRTAGNGAHPPPLALYRDAILSSDDITDANAGFDPNGGMPVVTMRLNDRGAETLAKATRENVGRRIAIVLDGVVLSAPVVVEPILRGEMMIQGGFTPEDAMDSRQESGRDPVNTRSG